MALHPKKKVEIVVERSRAGAVIETLERLGARGYTVVPSVAGKGQHRGATGGDWAVLDVYQHVMIIAVVDPAVAERITESCAALLENYSGIVTLSDVEVVRAQYF